MPLFLLPTMTRAHKTLLRGLLGLALLTAVLTLANPARVLAQWRQAHAGWLLAGLVAAIASNIVSALRWRALAQWLGATMGLRDAGRWYFQATGLNALLPGAVVGGDVWRAVMLRRAGQDAAAAGWSVLLDRVSGLWMLCAMGALGAAATANTLGPWLHLPAQPFAILMLSAAALWLAAPWALPWLLRWLPTQTQPTSDSTSALYAARPAKVSDAQTHQLRPTLQSAPNAPGGRPLPEADAREPSREASSQPRTARWLAPMHHMVARPDFTRQCLWQALASSAVQALSAAALACGALALNVHLGPAVWAFVMAPVFLMAALPASVGGWGTREAAAVAALAPFGVAAPVAVSISMIYGLYGLAQGSLGALAFGLPNREQHPA